MRFRVRSLRAAVGLGLSGLLVGSCAQSATLPPSGGQLALGTWGGDGAGVIVTDSSAHVHVGCTFGDMPGRIPLDASGRFTIDGSYVLQAYPVQIGPSLPAEFSGRVVGATLTLTISVRDTVRQQVVALGPITTTYGREPQMGSCPICRAPRGASRLALPAADDGMQPIYRTDSWTPPI